jgi:putative transposase
MPWGLKRFHQSRQLHFLTFSCYRRRANFRGLRERAVFESALERVRQHYDLCVYGYVVMLEHVHMLVNEPERETLARAMQSLRQSVARTLALRAADPFWQARYYDFNVWSERKSVEKLRYIHRNPVLRGLVERPEEWVWSSYRHYLSGVDGVVEIESPWKARKSEQAGIFPTVRWGTPVSSLGVRETGPGPPGTINNERGAVFGLTHPGYGFITCLTPAALFPWIRSPANFALMEYLPAVEKVVVSVATPPFV